MQIPIPQPKVRGLWRTAPPAASEVYSCEAVFVCRVGPDGGLGSGGAVKGYDGVADGEWEGRDVLCEEGCGGEGEGGEGGREGGDAGGGPPFVGFREEGVYCGDLGVEGWGLVWILVCVWKGAVGDDGGEEGVGGVVGVEGGGEEGAGDFDDCVGLVGDSEDEAALAEADFAEGSVVPGWVIVLLRDVGVELG